MDNESKVIYFLLGGVAGAFGLMIFNHYRSNNNEQAMKDVKEKAEQFGYDEAYKEFEELLNVGIQQRYSAGYLLQIVQGGR